MLFQVSILTSDAHEATTLPLFPLHVAGSVRGVCLLLPSRTPQLQFLSPLKPHLGGHWSVTSPSLSLPPLPPQLHSMADLSLCPVSLSFSDSPLPSQPSALGTCFCLLSHCRCPGPVSLLSCMSVQRVSSQQIWLTAAKWNLEHQLKEPSSYSQCPRGWSQRNGEAIVSKASPLPLSHLLPGACCLLLSPAGSPSIPLYILHAVMEEPRPLPPSFTVT